MHSVGMANGWILTGIDQWPCVNHPGFVHIKTRGKCWLMLNNHPPNQLSSDGSRFLPSRFVS